MISLAFGLPQVSVHAQANAKGTTLSFPFKYRENGPLTTRIMLGRQEVKFRKEPDFGKNDRIVRQALKVGPDENDFVGFAANLTSHTLYLDLNQNLDLTDDPRGIYRSEITRGTLGPYGFFRGVRLNLSQGGISRPYLLEPFYVLGEDTSYIYIRSYHEGEIELYGQKWRFLVQDNLDGQFDAQDNFLIMPAARGSQSKGTPYRPMPIPKNLFMGGHQFQLGFVL